MNIINNTIKTFLILVAVYTVYSIHIINENIKESETKVKRSLVMLEDKMLDVKVESTVDNSFIDEKLNDVKKELGSIDYDLSMHMKQLKNDLIILYKKIDNVENKLNKQTKYENAVISSGKILENYTSINSEDELTNTISIKFNTEQDWNEFQADQVALDSSVDRYNHCSSNSISWSVENVNE